VGQARDRLPVDRVHDRVLELDVADVHLAGEDADEDDDLLTPSCQVATISLRPSIAWLTSSGERAVMRSPSLMDERVRT